MKAEYKPPKGKKVEAILKAARDLFSVKGFENTPVAEIANRANVADGTVIYYFKTKENLLFILTRQIFYEMYKLTREAILDCLTPMEAMDAYVDAHLAYISNRRSDYLVLLKADPFRILSKELPDYQDAHLYYSLQIDLIEEILTRGETEGVFFPSLRRETAYVIYSMVMCSGKILATSEECNERLFEEIKRFIRYRLGTADLARETIQA